MKQLISRRRFLSVLGAAAAVGAFSSVAPVGASACLPFFDHLRRTPCGYIRGVAAKAPGVTAYKGIRYAEAGRWEYPRQVTRWNGIYDASEFGPCAMQDNAITPEWKNGRDQFYYHEFREGLDYTYSEDCQYLNIWAPDDAENAPVIVYIHGGAYMGGSGWDKAFDEPVWPSRGVIGVTINYRYGLFGYMCLPELAAEAGHTGNYGLYDADSVQMLCSTRATEGLVRRAVMSSGAGDVSSLFAPKKGMEEQYAFWNVWKTATGASTLEELRALSAEDALAAMGALFGSPNYGFRGVTANMGPLRLPRRDGQHGPRMG